MIKITHGIWKHLLYLAEQKCTENHDWNLRFGQCLWNITEELYPNLIEPLRGTEADPFHTGKDENSFSVCLFYDAIVDQNL